MRILVTGGAGFLGTALANKLVQEGHIVRVLDDLSAGDASYLDKDILFSRGDTRDIPRLWSLLKDVDCVYHLAARVSVPESIAYPVEYNDVNVGGTVSLMTAVRDARVKRVVLASSAAVYGNQAQQPISESAVLQPESPYAVSKVAAENYVQAIGKLWGIETVILRIQNAYGPNQPLPASHAPVVPRFLKQVCSGGSVILFGSGRQTRDFVYISDVTDALISAGSVPDIDGTICNIGSGSETSISELLDVIEKVTGREAHRLQNGVGEVGVSRLYANISRAQEVLGYSSRVNLETGLRFTLEQDVRFSPC